MTAVTQLNIGQLSSLHYNEFQFEICEYFPLSYISPPGVA
jgi:hypothetical protein